MNKCKNGANWAGSVVRSAIAVVLLAVASMPARAMLVTIISPVAPATEQFASAPVFAATEASGSCTNYPQTISALEGSTVEARAQYSAFLIKQPGFPGSQSDIPGSDIANPGIKIFFYSRLRFWLAQKSIPKLPIETLEKINDVSQTIHMLTVQCG